MREYLMAYCPYKKTAKQEDAAVQGNQATEQRDSCPVPDAACPFPDNANIQQNPLLININDTRNLI